LESFLRSQEKEMQTVLQRRADATLKRELQAAKESYQYRIRELQDRSREQALQKIAKELVRQRVEAQQLALADTSPHVGRGRGRTTYARFLELLRGSGNRLGLLTNGSQFRLVYAGIDFESWCEWESDRWFDGGDGTEELDGLRQLLSPESLKPVKSGVSGLLDGVEESRKRQADLSSVLRENVRQAVELLLEDVSTAHRTPGS
jgi:hypothetical protein